MDQDLDLARRAAAGDAAAFTALVRAHEAAVRRFLARLTRGANTSQGGADDLAQETFLRAWRMAGAYRGEGSYRGWLLRIAWTRLAGAARKRREAPGDELGEVGHDPRPDRMLDTERALAALSPSERAAALLCFGHGHSHGEAAAIMGLPLGTLKSIVARARAKLADHLGDAE